MDRDRLARPKHRRAACAAVAVAAATTVGSPPAQAETVNVTAANLAFSPSSVPVQLTAGEPGFEAPHAHVIWTMNDPGTEHTVTFDDPKLVSSPRLPAGQRHEVVLYLAGTVTYRCTIHPAMTGSVVVTPGPPAPSPTQATGQTTGPVRQGEGDGSGGIPVLPVAAAAGVAVAAGLGWLLLRRRRPGTDGSETP